MNKTTANSLNKNTIIYFGKYKDQDKTFEQIQKEDYSYSKWLENKWTELEKMNTNIAYKLGVKEVISGLKLFKGKSKANRQVNYFVPNKRDLPDRNYLCHYCLNYREGRRDKNLVCSCCYEKYRINSLPKITVLRQKKVIFSETIINFSDYTEEEILNLN